MVRKGDRNFVPTDDTVLSAGDAVLVVAEREEAIAKAAAQLGKLEPGRLASDRADLDYIRVFVGKASVVGVPARASSNARRLSHPPACTFGATTPTWCRHPT